MATAYLSSLRQWSPFMHWFLPIGFTAIAVGFVLTPSQWFVVKVVSILVAAFEWIKFAYRQRHPRTA